MASYTSSDSFLAGGSVKQADTMVDINARFVMHKLAKDAVLLKKSALFSAHTFLTLRTEPG